MGRGGAGGWRKTRRIQKIAVHPRAAPGAGRTLGLKIGRAALVLSANRMEWMGLGRGLSFPERSG